MKKKIFFSTLILIVVAAFALSACNIFGANPAQSQTSQVETMAAATISVRLTQMAFDAIIAQATQQAIASSTPFATNTSSAPIPTNTPYVLPATPIPATKTPIPVPCNLASFVSDVTVKDGTKFYPGDAFIKTWKVTNIGSCPWTTDYTIYLSSGESMDAIIPVNFPETISPGESVNLSVKMYAPSDTGTHEGNWMLKSAKGTKFGVGASGSAPLYVSINVISVPKSKDPNIVFDFVRKYCLAKWKTNGGVIDCPSFDLNFRKGSITRSFTPVLEGGGTDDEGALFTVPATGGDGMIRGKFPALTIHSGDFFKSQLYCGYKMTKCSVTFELLYSDVGSDTLVSLATWDKNYGDQKIIASVDLSTLDGKEVNLYLKVSSKGNSEGDVAIWLAPRITHP